MTTAKHTPGPWIVDADGSVAEAAGPKTICRMGSGADVVTDKMNRNAAEVEANRANARLIAAAPDLLAALERALALNAVNCSFGPQADDPECCTCGRPKAYHWKVDARAAIRKATEEVQ